MDGSASAFLQDTPLFSRVESRAGTGILYIEDFDDAPEPAGLDNPPEPETPAPLTLDDVQLARDEGRAEGLQAALADAQLIQAQLHASAIQSVADELHAARALLERMAQTHAQQTASAMIAILQAAVPATMKAHAAAEISGVVQALSAGFACEPELRVRTHPDLADVVREIMIDQLPEEGCVLAVAADPRLAQGDVQIAWQDGRAKRDCAAIWSEIRIALAPLGLPSIEEICHGH